MRGGIRFGLPWLAAACFAVLAAASIALPPAANAASVEFCVACKGPNASYRCRVQGSGATQSDALKLYCVVRTAKEGGHASCSARKIGAGCDGAVKAYQYDGPSLPPNAPTEQKLRNLNERVERENRAFDEKKGEQPKSLIELGGRAYDASKRGLKNAGSAIGLGETAPKPQAVPKQQAAPPPPPATQNSAPPQKNFARRSFDCMRSLFRECGNE
ncbi:hypothetical protein [Methyloceanibacter sp.]|uniref:hypothetical protein n=1 Tax=Methyloceanibacter sp. TaxID=1965321 RepID=UPI002CAA3CC8|nr:hypothetical protein [Methyloceanibacter sp.]HML92125.1 hypothetical protein [Methyloceanibacter sp.]